MKAKLIIKENAKPIFSKVRQLPFSLKSLFEEEIYFVVCQGVLKKVNTSEYTTPIVPVLKQNNKVRICGDAIVNPQLVVDDYHLPTLDDFFAEMSDCTILTKIDLKQVYLQLEVDEESEKILNSTTHMGLYQSTRLWYDASPAVAIWHRNIENILAKLKRTKAFLDDICICGILEN